MQTGGKYRGVAGETAKLATSTQTGGKYRGVADETAKLATSTHTGGKYRGVARRDRKDKRRVHQENLRSAKQVMWDLCKAGVGFSNHLVSIKLSHHLMGSVSIKTVSYKPSSAGCGFENCGTDDGN